MLQEYKTFLKLSKKTGGFITETRVSLEKNDVESQKKGRAVCWFFLSYLCKDVLFQNRYPAIGVGFVSALDGF
jgi:hypothetical protein